MIDPNLILKKYGRLSLKDRLHIFLRYKSCPWQKILDNMPRGLALVDIGCGHGLLINIIDSYLPFFTRLVGIDRSPDKIRIAKKTASDKISFYVSDLEQIKERADIYSIFDVLYLIPYKEQELLIEDIYKRLPDGGYLIIKEIDTKPPLKHILNKFEEIIMVRLLKVTFGGHFYYRSADEYIDIVRKKGFKVTSVDLQKGYMHPHVMFICQK